MFQNASSSLLLYLKVQANYKLDVHKLMINNISYISTYLLLILVFKNTECMYIPIYFYNFYNKRQVCGVKQQQQYC